MKPPGETVPLEWAVAQRALPGQNVSGDLHLVQPHERGVLLAVVDGIGHGPEATHAAEIAVAALRRQPGGPVHALVARCHAALQRTRGVVLTVASLDLPDGTLTWCGVGNVEAILMRGGQDMTASERALLRGGMVGAHLPPLHAGIVPVSRGDLLILTSDGIRPDYGRDLPLKGSPQLIADHILRRYFKGTDDACVLVARFAGNQS